MVKSCDRSSVALVPHATASITQPARPVSAQQPENVLGHEQTLKLVSLLLVAASLGLGTRLFTELTVYTPIFRARICEVWLQYGSYPGHVIMPLQ